MTKPQALAELYELLQIEPEAANQSVNERKAMIKVDSLRDLIDNVRGLKRKWVAEKIGVTEGMFKQVMTGRSQIGKDKAKVLAKLLGVKLADIWSD